MRRVILESPYAGDVDRPYRRRWPQPQRATLGRNVAYARACLRDSLSRGEAPIASHLLYTQPGVLCDELPTERQWGIDADHGISEGMRYGIAAAKAAGLPVEYRTLTDAHDSAIARKVLEDVESGRGRLVSGTELQERLAALETEG